MESSMEIPQKAKDRIALWFSDITPGHLPKGMWQDTIETPVHQCSLQHYLRYPSFGNNSGAL
jgi:hypothetical protein